MVLLRALSVGVNAGDGDGHLVACGKDVLEEKGLSFPAQARIECAYSDGSGRHLCRTVLLFVQGEDLRGFSK